MCVYVCMCVSLCVCMHLGARVCVYKCACARVCVCVCVCVCVVKRKARTCLRCIFASNSRCSAGDNRERSIVYALWEREEAAVEERG